MLYGLLIELRTNISCFIDLVRNDFTDTNRKDTSKTEYSSVNTAQTENVNLQLIVLVNDMKKKSTRKKIVFFVQV